MEWNEHSMEVELASLGILLLGGFACDNYASSMANRVGSSGHQ